MESLCIQKLFFELRFKKIEALLVEIFHIQKKTVLILQDKKTQSGHQLQFSSLDFALNRLTFFVYSKIAFFRSILSNMCFMKFGDVSWRMNFSIFNKGEQKSFFIFIFLLRRSAIPMEWNYNAFNSQVIDTYSKI